MSYMGMSFSKILSFNIKIFQRINNYFKITNGNRYYFLYIHVYLIFYYLCMCVWSKKLFNKNSNLLQHLYKLAYISSGKGLFKKNPPKYIMLVSQNSFYHMIWCLNFNENMSRLVKGYWQSPIVLLENCQLLINR